MDLSRKIIQNIKASVEQTENHFLYREPLVGFASAQDPLFDEMKKIIGPHHLHPKEMLKDAKTVVCFFLPFARNIIESNQKNIVVSREWAEAYIETNKLINHICKALKELLEKEGIEAVTEKATHNFDEKTLRANWSHRSAAYVAGLGTFGVNRMLITKAGCAGRYGSLIISAEIPPTPRPSEAFCRYDREGKCLFCVNHCPTKALTVEGLDKQKCYQHLLEVNRHFPDLGLCDVCGKCAVGPCAMAPF